MCFSFFHFNAVVVVCLIWLYCMGYYIEMFYQWRGISQDSNILCIWNTQHVTYLFGGIFFKCFMTTIQLLCKGMLYVHQLIIKDYSIGDSHICNLKNNRRWIVNSHFSIERNTSWIFIDTVCSIFYCCFLFYMVLWGKQLW